MSAIVSKQRHRRSRADSACDDRCRWHPTVRAPLNSKVRAISNCRSGQVGALGSVWPDSVVSDSKSPRRIFRRGLGSCDDENMPVICPTCQNVFSRGTGRDVPVGDEIITLHGVVFDILV
jgi:hypothetical protein